MDNFLNIDPTERDSVIYRIMSLERLLSIFETNNLTLTRAQYWRKEDPHENYIMEKEYIYLGNNVGVGYKDRFYCQSWSLGKESMKMWEEYSHGGEGVRVKTSIKKLLDSLWCTRKSLDLQDRECFIGKIEYKSLEEIEELSEFYGNNFLACFTDRDMLLQALTLLVKRQDKYWHEEEVRLIYYDTKNEFKEDFLVMELIQIICLKRLSLSQEWIKIGVKIFLMNLRGNIISQIR